jgi:hypothetical protein
LEVKQCNSTHGCTKEVSKEITKHMELNGNENRTHQNLWDTAKAVLTGKSIELNTCLRKEEVSDQ